MSYRYAVFFVDGTGTIIEADSHSEAKSSAEIRYEMQVASLDLEDCLSREGREIIASSKLAPKFLYPEHWKE